MPPERHDTHISTVLLAGDWAYKLKKPVVWPFLDFSTAAARRHFCLEELRLNRRTAPELYLDVRPLSHPVEVFLRDPAAALAASDKATATDWVLRMRRFPPGALWAERAAAGLLTPADAEALAAHLADFHTGLPPVPAPAPGQGPVHGLAHWLQASLQAIAQHPQRPAWLDAPRWHTVSDRVLALLQALRPWLAARQAQGHVREGHGDLHLGNIVQWLGRPLAFDAIEFSAELRTVDTMNDAAFAAMDLLAHGLPVLAWRFWGAYAERMGDHAGLAGWRLWVAYRALVRAQVALLSGAVPGVLERYWRCAEAVLAPPAPPRLVLTQGPSGSGKSTVAALVCDALAARGQAAVRLRSDVERKRLHGLDPTERGGPALYTPPATQRTYAHLQALARPLLDAGVSVVVDAAFLHHAERQAMRAMAGQASAPCHLLQCRADPARMVQRLQARQAQGLDPSDATPQVLARQLQTAEPLPADWAPLCHTVHNDGTRDDLQGQVSDWVAGVLGTASC
ncbi:bifunctional aminoglycoside phosphotransferase/ATP-binding protein [Aquabacterium sp. A08]|uniref:bifunctional aminoglycoside phosphotransferase/ATP-binding protein n=2 Tax=Aquabacterium sp. A08 TaxID=2718532 RepID=UPI001AAE8EFC|nr:bifunctional aminoglycoside phosphotransferase/ATP-binding protein [Aquabacterium sp. A08]